MPTQQQALTQLTAQLEQYTAQAKEGWETPLRDAELAELETLLEQSGYHDEAFEQAQQGNYEKFESVPLMLKNYLGTQKLQAFLQAHGSDVRDARVQQALQEHALDPAFRVGLSIARHQGTAQARELEKCEQFMNQYVMERTLAPVSPAAKRRLTDTLGDGAAQALQINQEKQLMMAKILFLGQLGRFDQKGTDGQVKPYDETLAEAFAHGGRTKIALPHGKGQTRMLKALMGSTPERTMGLTTRWAGTHHVGRPSVDGQGRITGSWQETKPPSWFLPWTLSSEHKGLNVAVGGLGEVGPTGKPILHDGGNGHMYMRTVKGNASHCGVLLVGFENAGPGKKSCLGKPHGLSGSKAAQSVFMADKGAPGAVEDGRAIDLSGMDPDGFCRVMNAFDAHYRKLMEGAGTPEGAARLAEFNHKLCGGCMDRQDLTETLESMRLSPEETQQTVDRARRAPVNAYDLPSRKVRPIGERQAPQWEQSLSQKLRDDLHLDMSNPQQAAQRLLVMENCAGKWKMVPLFDPQLHNTSAARYERFQSLINEGREIYAYGLGEQLPRRLMPTPGRADSVTVSEQVSAIAPPAPKKPGFFKKMFNKATFGWAFKADMERYEREKNLSAKHQTVEGRRAQRKEEITAEAAAYRATQAQTERTRERRRTEPSLQRQTTAPQRQSTAPQRPRSSSVPSEAKPPRVR